MRPPPGFLVAGLFLSNWSWHGIQRWQWVTFLLVYCYVHHSCIVDIKEGKSCCDGKNVIFAVMCIVYKVRHSHGSAELHWLSPKTPRYSTTWRLVDYISSGVLVLKSIPGVTGGRGGRGGRGCLVRPFSVSESVFWRKWIESKKNGSFPSLFSNRK